MRRLGTAIGGGLAVVTLSLLRPGEPLRPNAEPAKARILEGYGRLPLRFERSQGPAAGPAQYLSRGPGFAMWVAPTEMVLSLRKADAPAPNPGHPRSVERRSSVGRAVLRMKLLQGRADAAVEGLEELPGKTNYLIGSDPRRWRTGVPGYAKVRCRGVYPGIDLVYYGGQRHLEYDFVVAPGADPGLIRLGFEGTRGLRLDGEGSLVVAVEGGEVVKRAPPVYQEEGTSKQPVRGRWVLRGTREAGFEVGAYDPRRTLVIDPVLSYSTYLGGSQADGGFGIAVDSQGSAYVTGATYSPDFPTQNPYQTDQPSLDVFVTKLSPSGNSLAYSTYLGGSFLDYAYGIAVDSQGAAYVTGITQSPNFPTQNPYQTDQPFEDAFVTKLSPSGNSLVYSTYLGGSGSDGAYGIVVDSQGSAYVTGRTFSPDFPTQNPYQTAQPPPDAFVSKLSPSGNSLVYSTYLGGSFLDYAYGIAVDSQGAAHVTGITQSPDFPTQNPYQTDQPGEDAFVTKLSPSGNSLVYSTYLGGSGSDGAYGITVDGPGSPYVTGWTDSPDFPTQNPYQTDQPFFDAFVTKLSLSGDSLVYSTYLGGSGVDGTYSIAVDSLGSAYVTGETRSPDFPTQDPYQTDQPLDDAFVTKLSPSGNSVVYSTYLGGSDFDFAYGITVDGQGSAYLTGETRSPDFPTQNPYQTDQPMFDVFVTRLSPSGPPADFFTVPPCRVIDTRNAAGPYGGPALAAGTDRTFVLAGQCGVPAAARAVSVNIAVTAPTAAGHLRLYPAGAALPLTSSINYAAGQTRSNNGIVLLTSGAITVRTVQGSGTVHLIVDTNGYFE